MGIPNSQYQYPICLVYDEDLDILAHGCQGGYFIPLDALLFIKSKIENTIEFANNNNVDLLNHPPQEPRIPMRKMENNITKEVVDRPTNIYVMIDKNTGYYKIGRSKKPLKREATLQSEKPTIELLFHFLATDSLERALHEMFSEQRIRGEWFNLTDANILAIKQIGGVL